VAVCPLDGDKEGGPVVVEVRVEGGVRVRRHNDVHVVVVVVVVLVALVVVGVGKSEGEMLFDVAYSSGSCWWWWNQAQGLPRTLSCRNKICVPGAGKMWLKTENFQVRVTCGSQIIAFSRITVTFCLVCHFR
jgi:hypothetical protein